MPSQELSTSSSSLTKLSPVLPQVGKLIQVDTENVLILTSQNFLSSAFLQGVCMLALLIFVYTMFSRVIVLEKQLELPHDSAYSKVQKNFN